MHTITQGMNNSDNIIYDGSFEIPIFRGIYFKRISQVTTHDYL